MTKLELINQIKREEVTQKQRVRMEKAIEILRRREKEEEKENV